MKPTNPMEQLIVNSLIKQAEILAACDIIHYEEVNKIYRELVTVLIGFLDTSKIDVIKANELLAKAAIKVKYQEVIEEIQPQTVKKFTKTKKK